MDSTTEREAMKPRMLRKKKKVGVKFISRFGSKMKSQLAPPFSFLFLSVSLTQTFQIFFEWSVSRLYQWTEATEII